MHTWRENHFSRRVIGLDTNYFIVSRRCICHACEKQAELQHKVVMTVVENAAAHAGLRVVLADEDVVLICFTSSVVETGYEA